MRYLRVITGLLAAFAALTAAAQESAREVWSFATPAAIQTSPAVGPDGTIFFGGDDGVVRALTPEGTERWSFKTGSSLAASPAVDADGTVYAASTDRVLYAFYPDGRVKWLASPGAAMVASPAITGDGGVVVATVFNVVACFGPGGNKRWEYRAGGNIVSSPAIAANGTIYFGAKDNKLYALSADGRLKWQYTAGGQFNTSPALGADGLIYLGSLDGVFHAVRADGTRQWTFQAADAIRSSAALGADGMLYFGCDDGQLYALSAGGQLKWRYATGDQVRSSPAVADDGTILVGSYDGKLHAVRPDGALRWVFATGDKVSSSPTLRTDGSVVFGSWDKKLYAVQAEAVLARSAWPKFRGDLRQTGGVPVDRGAPKLELMVVSDRRVVAPALLKLVATLTGRDSVAAKVEFFSGPTLLGESTHAPYTWNWPDAGAGEYDFSARATLPSGQFIVSPQVRVKVAPPDAAMARPPSRTPPDTSPPRVFLTSPLTETRFEKAELELRGTASDDRTVGLVEYRLGDGAFQKADGTTRWSARVRLEPGENRLAIRALDGAGNHSPELERVLTYAMRLPLDVTVTGEGVIRSDQEDRLVEAGRTVKLRAEPKRGFLFAGWNGSIRTNTVEVSFVMGPDLKLEALFVPNPYDQLAGDFTGLVTQPAGDTVRAIGLLQVNVSDRGAWRGRLAFAGESHAVSGEFGPLGASVLTLERSGQPPLQLALKVDLGGDPDLITGTVSDGAVNIGFIGDRHVFDGRRHKSPQAGSYTLAITARDEEADRAMGEGFASVTVDEKGIARLAGMLGNGTPLKHEAALSANGVWPVYVPLAEGRGALAGWVQFKRQDFADLFGQLTWSWTAAQGTLREMPVMVIGEAYQPPGRGAQSLAGRRGMVALRGGDLPELLAVPVSLEANHRAAAAPGAPSELTLQITPGTGSIQGSFVHPLTGRLVNLHGVVLQQQNSGTGLFLGPTNAGRFSLTVELEERPAGP